jgi:hypothetical protein
MLRSLTLSTATMAMSAMIISAACAAGAVPTVQQALFDAKHIVGLTPGAELVYKFERKPSDEAVLGKAFTDTINVKIENDAKDGKKDVLIQIYTGERARDPQKITEMDGNPMLIVYLDNAVAHFRELAGGDRAYLKNTFSKHLGTQAKVEPVTISFRGADVPGYKVVATPYANDPARAKMRGYEGAVFTLYVSDKIPGHFAKMTSNFINVVKDGPRLDEITTLDGVGEIK